MIVCHCAVVTDRDVDDAVERGNLSLSAVCRDTGAGQDCGACIFSIKALVCQHRQEQPDVPEVDRAAS